MPTTELKVIEPKLVMIIKKMPLLLEWAWVLTVRGIALWNGILRQMAPVRLMNRVLNTKSPVILICTLFGKMQHGKLLITLTMVRNKLLSRHLIAVVM